MYGCNYCLRCLEAEAAETLVINLTGQEAREEKVFPKNYAFSTKDLRRVSRLVSEALDLSLVLATMLSKSKEVTIKWIVDIIDQILPTAYVYNTGYWPLYVLKDTKEFLCLCNIFSINCTHTYNGMHCLKINSVQLEENDYNFKLPKIFASRNFRVTSKINLANDAYLINIKLEDLENNTYTKVNMRAVFKEGLYDTSTLRLILSPHPLRLRIYGIFVKSLRWNFKYNYPFGEIPTGFIISGDDLPSFTLVIDKSTINISRRILIKN